MHIFDFYAVFFEVIGQLFAHAFGQRGDKHPAARRHDGVDFGQQIVDLPLGRPYGNGGIEKSRRTDELFHDVPRLPEFVRRRRRGYANELRNALVEFFKGQRTVVVSRFHAKSVFDQIFFAGKIAVIHSADLRDGHMTLVDEYQKLPFGEIIEQGKGRLARVSAVKIAGIVFDARTISDLPDHFQVMVGALREPLGFEKFPLGAEGFHFVFQIAGDERERGGEFLTAHGIMTGRKDDGVFELADDLPRQRILFKNAVDLVAEKFHADGNLRIGGGENFQNIPVRAERGAFEVHVVARILQFGEPPHELVPFDLHAGAQGDTQPKILFGCAQAVNTGHRRNHDDVFPFAQRTGRGVAEFVDFVVQAQVLFDIGIGGGNVALGLIIIVIGNKIFHAIFGEKLPEFIAELRGQRLVMRDDQRGLAHVLDDVRHGEGLAAARNAQQYLRAHAVQNALRQFFDCLRLIARRLKFGMNPEFHISLRKQTFFSCIIPRIHKKSNCLQDKKANNCSGKNNPQKKSHEKREHRARHSQPDSEGDVAFLL